MVLGEDRPYLCVMVNSSTSEDTHVDQAGAPHPGDTGNGRDRLPRLSARAQLIVAIVLSLATFCSTLCGYRAQVWSGTSSNAASAADSSERKAAENTIVGLQVRTMDGLRVLEWWRAIRQGDTKSADLLKSHFPARLLVAIDASVAAGALTKPGVPGPLERSEYVIEEESLAKQQREEAGRLRATANAAGLTANAYVLLTLLFASVLFFGGIASTFDRPRIRLSMAVVSAGLFLFAVAKMLMTGLGGAA